MEDPSGRNITLGKNGKEQTGVSGLAQFTSILAGRAVATNRCGWATWGGFCCSSEITPETSFSITGRRILQIKRWRREKWESIPVSSVGAMAFLWDLLALALLVEVLLIFLALSLLTKGMFIMDPRESRMSKTAVWKSQMVLFSESKQKRKGKQTQVLWVLTVVRT